MRLLAKLEQRDFAFLRALPLRLHGEIYPRQAIVVAHASLDGQSARSRRLRCSNAWNWAARYLGVIVHGL
jgi:hypothetical protein